MLTVMKDSNGFLSSYCLIVPGVWVLWSGHQGRFLVRRPHGASPTKPVTCDVALRVTDRPSSCIDMVTAYEEHIIML